jgi:hypothetical protein
MAAWNGIPTWFWTIPECRAITLAQAVLNRLYWYMPVKPAPAGHPTGGRLADALDVAVPGPVARWPARGVVLPEEY